MTSNIERISEAELKRRWGLTISRHGVNLVNITAEEATHLQRFPLVNGPNPALTQQLWRKLSNPANWALVERRPSPIDIEIHASDRGFAEWTLTLIPGDASAILVAGSMDGHEPALLRTMRPGAVCHVIDLLAEHAARLRRRGFVSAVMDLHRLAYAPKSLAAVYNNNVMEHIYNDVGECFGEVHDVLKPGGTFVFVMPTETNFTNPDAGWQITHVGRAHDWWLVDPAHPWKTDLHDIQARLVAAGFERPTFAYLEETLRHSVARARVRTSWRRAIEQACRVVSGSILLQRAESAIRSATGFYGYLGVRRWLRYRLGLPNRQTDTLQVAVRARRPL